MVDERRYQRIKVDQHWAIRVPRISAMLIDQGFRVSPERDDYGILLGGLPSWYSSAAIGHYLNDEVQKSIEMTREFLRWIELYFFGEWRSRVLHRAPRHGDIDWKRGGGQWVEQYRLASAFGLALGEWDKVVQLSEFAMHAQADRLARKGEMAWARVLAQAIVAANDGAEESEDVDVPPKSHANDLVRSCRAVLEGSVAEASREYHQAFAKYLRGIKGLDQVESKLWIDGTSLYHLARRRGVLLSEDEKLRDHLVIY